VIGLAWQDIFDEAVCDYNSTTSRKASMAPVN